MGTADEFEMERENDRQDVRAASLEAQAVGFLECMADEIDSGDALDELIDLLIDDTSDLREFAKRVLKGEEQGRYAEQVRNAATQVAYRMAREAE